jgi:hypothetical protein
VYSVESSINIKADQGDDMFVLPGLIDVLYSQLHGINNTALFSTSKATLGKKAVGLISVRDALYWY